MRIINANFTKLFYAQAISAIGDFVFDTTLILWISTRLLADRDYAPAAVSGVLVAVAVGIIVVGPAAGVFVDRWDKRRTMMASDLVRAALVAGLGVVAALPEGAIPVSASLVLIYVAVLLATGFSQFFNPARFAILGDIVDTDEGRAKAASLGQSVGYTAAIIGPPLAAPLLFQTGPYWALFLNAASFVLSFLLIRLVRLAPSAAPAEAPPKKRFLTEFRAGLGYSVRAGRVRTLMISVTTVTLGAGALNAMMVFFLVENLNSRPEWFGTIGMGEGLGAIAGALTAGWICKRLGDVRVFSFGLMIAGVGLVVFARLDNLWQAVVFLAVLGIPLGALNVALTPILLRAVPRELLGRVAGIVNPVQYVASMTAALASGWLASTVLRDFHSSVGPFTLGRIDVIFTVGGLVVLIGGVYALLGLRREEPSPAGGEPAPPDHDPAAPAAAPVPEAA